MTRLEALDDMIAAVRAGETSRVHIERMSGKAGLAEAGSIYGSAYQDDLNAARMVHSALLPGWDYILGHTNDGLTIHAKTGPYDNEFADNLGRALLLSSLKAYRNEMTLGIRAVS